MKQSINVIAIILLMLMLTCVASYAGDLQPPAGEPTSTMVTLQEIFDKVDALEGYQLESSQPPKTGQTTSYATGDDGDHEIGETIPSPRFTDNGDGSVTDNLTGLIWLKNANATGDTRNWAEALSDVAQLNTDGKMNNNDSGDTSNGGVHQTDWRLPNRFELESLINHAYYAPSISNAAGDAKWGNDDPFINVQSGGYWSGTTSAKSTSDAWNVGLSYGEVLNDNKSNSCYVWPVRGGREN